MTKNNKYSITIGWLYPDLMSTYGDRGNIIVLQKRTKWRGINVRIEQISISTSENLLATCDLLFMGGAQDTQQEIVNRDLQAKKGKFLIDQIEKDVPGLYICGAYQFLGKYYRTADNKKLPGLSIFPLYTENPSGAEPSGAAPGEGTKRLIGNVLVESKINGLTQPLVGFENHGGRTFLEDKSMALGTVVKGFGNNGQDKTEGVVYKNSFGSYLHGPILPKNPHFADLLIKLALEKKYKKKINLSPLDDILEWKAHSLIAKKLGIKL